MQRARKLASAAEFADAMSTLASGVVMVTCRLGGRPWGTTVTAFASVSADPPTVLVSLGSDTAAARAVGDTRRFGVSVLAGNHVDVARYGSAPRAPKFLERFLASGDGVAGALAHLECDVAEEVQIGDHTVFFGRVRAARASKKGSPLLYHRRAYRQCLAS